MSKNINNLTGWRRDGLFLLLAALAVGLYVFLAGQRFAIGFPLDDAWIHQVYARNLAQEGQWAFVQGESSAASTSPLYSLLLALGNLLGLTPFAWAYGLGIAALGLAASMGGRLGERLFPTVPYVGLGTGLAMLLAWHHVWAAASGMETMLFMALSLAVLYAASWEVHLLSQLETTPTKPLSANQANRQARERSQLIETAFKPRVILMRGAGVGLLGGLLTLARPEGMLLLGLIGLGMWVALGQPRHYLPWALAVGLGWLVIVSPYTAWNYDLTGDLLPSTAEAKIAETAPFRQAFIGTRYLDLLLPMVAGAQVLAIPGILLGMGLLIGQARAKRRYWLYLVPLLWALAHLSIYALRLPAPFQHGRYVMPILPPLLLYAVGGMIVLVQRYHHTPLQRVLVRTLALSAALAFPSFLWIGAGAYANDVRIINTEMVETAKWVRDNIPTTDRFAVHDIGALGYYAPRDILDLAGLVSPELVPIINNYPAQMDLLCSRGIQWLMVLPDQRPAPADDSRLRIAYESPYDFADEARGHPTEAWKMRVYAVDCTPAGAG